MTTITLLIVWGITSGTILFLYITFSAYRDYIEYKNTPIKENMKKEKKTKNFN